MPPTMASETGEELLIMAPGMSYGCYGAYEDAAPGDEVMWQCAACTHLNASASSACMSCDSARPDVPSSYSWGSYDCVEDLDTNYRAVYGSHAGMSASSNNDTTNYASCDPTSSNNDNNSSSSSSSSSIKTGGEAAKILGNKVATMWDKAFYGQHATTAAATKSFGKKQVSEDSSCEVHVGAEASVGGAGGATCASVDGIDVEMSGPVPIDSETPPVLTVQAHHIQTPGALSRPGHGTDAIRSISLARSTVKDNVARFTGPDSRKLSEWSQRDMAGE